MLILATVIRHLAFFQRYSDFGNKDLKPELNESLSIGVNLQKPSLGLKFNVNYFENKFTDLIGFDFITSQYFNQKKSSAKGWEVSLSWDFWIAQTKLMYTQLEAEDENGQRLVRRPDRKATFTANFQVTSKQHLGFRRAASG